MTKAWHILILVVVAFSFNKNAPEPLFNIGGDQAKSAFVFDTGSLGIWSESIPSVLAESEKAMLNYSARDGDSGE